MTEQPFEPHTEQDWLGNPDVSPAEAYLQGHRIPTSELSSIAKLDILEAGRAAGEHEAEVFALWRARLNAQKILNIAEKESRDREEEMQLALAVEDTARREVLKATEAIEAFARKMAGA